MRMKIIYISRFKKEEEEASSSKNNSSFSIDSLHDKLLALSKRIELIGECIDMNTTSRTSVALNDIKSKRAFIEVKNGTMFKLNEMTNNLDEN